MDAKPNISRANRTDESRGEIPPRFSIVSQAQPVVTSSGSNAMEAEHRVLYHLAQAERAMHLFLDRKLKSLGISITGYSVLRLVMSEPHISASEIARRTLVSQQASSRLIDRLAAMRLLRKRTGIAHSLALSLSRKGEEVLAQADAIVLAQESELRNHLGENATLSLDATLLSLKRKFEEELRV